MFNVLIIYTYVILNYILCIYIRTKFRENIVLGATFQERKNVLKTNFWVITIYVRSYVFFNLCIFLTINRTSKNWIFVPISSLLLYCLCSRRAYNSYIPNNTHNDVYNPAVGYNNIIYLFNTYTARRSLI